MVNRALSVSTQEHEILECTCIGFQTRDKSGVRHCVQEKDLQSDARVCSRHFPNGDTSNFSPLSMGKRFPSLKKRPVSIRVPVRPKQGKKRVKKSLFERSSPSHSTLPDSAATSTLGDSEYDSSLPSTSNVDWRETRREEKTLRLLPLWLA